MSRSGYSDDCEDINLWRGTVARAIGGKRGQAFLAELLAALDAMPVKQLIPEELEMGGEVCAIGSVGIKRGLDMSDLDVEEPRQIAKQFGIAPALVQEIEYMNDEGTYLPETPEERWTRMRAWVASQIADRATRQGA